MSVPWDGDERHEHRPRVLAEFVRREHERRARKLEADALALVSERCDEGEMLGAAINGVTLVYYPDGRRPVAMRTEDVPGGA